jgi:putative SOS response-associated peptidase YedK
MPKLIFSIMCGRFAQFLFESLLKEHSVVCPPGIDLSANYNVAPSQPVFTVVQHEGVKYLEKLNWGLVPFWAKDVSIGNKMINSRLETIATKPSFKAAFKYRRCLIPANGFYEWKGERGNKQPYYFTLPTGKPFAFAGLWETWKPKDASDTEISHRSCTIITTKAGPSVQDIHSRMPVILSPDVYNRWLDPRNRDIKNLKELLQKESSRELKKHPVSKRVNRVQNNTPDLIIPV